MTGQAWLSFVSHDRTACPVLRICREVYNMTCRKHANLQGEAQGQLQRNTAP